MKKAYFIAFFVFVLASGMAYAGDTLFEVKISQFDWWRTIYWGFNDFTNVKRIAIQYRPAFDQEVCTVKQGMYKVSNPTDNVVLTVRENGLNTGNILQTVTLTPDKISNPPFIMNNLPTYTEFRLSPCLYLIVGTNYFFIFSRTNPGSAGNYVSELMFGDRPETTYFVEYGGTWNTNPTWSAREWSFRLEGPDTKEPVIIVPGILGSRLNKVSDGDEVWPSKLDLITSLSDDFLDDLILSTLGEEISGKELGASEILETTWPFTVYGNLVDAFREKGYEDGEDLFTVAYDWRFSVQESANVLANIIDQALANSPTGKVNIVAHSMGGLVTKEYLSRQDVSDSFNKVILLGVPNLGAPKAFKVLNYGDDFDLSTAGIGLNTQKAKEISQNMPGVHELLPSREYINLKGGYVRDFRNNQNLTLSYEQTNNFMTSDSDLPDYRNSLLINLADMYHRSIDITPISGPEVFNIMGCQNPDTIGEIRLYDEGNIDITATDGDGTVPLTSARANSDNYNNYYVLYSQTEVNHSGLVKDGNITKFVSDLITEINPSLPLGVSQSIDSCLDNLPNPTKIIFSTHSPVNLHIYDGQNNHTGLNIDGDYEANIPGSNFYMIGENSFASVPVGNQYRIVIDALSSGSFDFKIKSYSGSVLSDSAAYLNLKLLDDSFQAEMNFNDMPSLSLNIDNNGDGIIDEIKTPDVEFLGQGEEDAIPPSIEITEPIFDTYTRSTVMSLIIDTTDLDSGMGLVQKYFDNKLISGDFVDLFFKNLGNHLINVLVYDNSGNPAKTHKNITIIATVQSTISDLERIYNLGWANNDVKNSLKALLEASLPTTETTQSKGKKADGALGTAFLKQLEMEYNKGNINQQAYGLLKEDIEWLLR